METLNISEKRDNLNWDYDAEADVLNLSFGNPKNAEGVDIGEGTISGSKLTQKKSSV